jgi:hypothetical protein
MKVMKNKLEKVKKVAKVNLIKNQIIKKIRIKTINKINLVSIKN